MGTRFITLILALSILLSCREKREIKTIEGRCIAVTTIEQNGVAEQVRKLIENGNAAVDSVKAPIIGECAKRLTLFSPESPLMNFAADALMKMAKRHSKERIDIAITNKGGLRSEINEGTITFGDIYNVFPFENTLVLLTLDGKQLWKLFEEIAKEDGEAISGAKIEMTKNGKLINATVAGKPIVPTKRYRIATSDYLSQGNDGLSTLATGIDKIEYSVTIRDLMIEYVESLDKQKVAVDADCDGRIKIVTE